MKNHSFALGFTAALVALLAMGAAYVGPWAPSPFTQRISTNTTATAWRTALSVTNATGLEATLAGNNTFTGTNTASGPFNITNAASTISGNGAGLTNLSFPNNGIGVRHLWTSPTNIFLSSMVASSSLTNNGDFASGTYVAKFDIPPLLGSNSSLSISIMVLRTNANASAGVLNFYIGSNTNFIGNNSTLLGTTVGHTGGHLSDLLQCWASYTNQLQGVSFQNVLITRLTNFADMSISNTVYVSAMTSTSHTNAQFILRAYEVYAP